jgi:serine/threonine-protein kinase
VDEWRVPGYTELRPVGSGGFGAVMLATHDATGMPVAIKYLRSELADEPGFVAMFRAEAVTLSSLENPYVVRLYEYVEAPVGAAIVMELVDGVSLQQILARQGKTTPEAALVVLYGSLLGLAAAHAHGVVHRDYKPGNVLVNAHGASKLTDFGIAERAGMRQLPAGTLAYAPPEQFDGGPARPAGDVYAATATFYECLTGHPPFTGQTAETILNQHRTADVPMDEVPEPLQPLVARGMAKDPGYRPADAAALAAELRAVAVGAYGESWETRGRTHLAEAALLLALLWPSAGTPALTGTTVEQVHLSEVIREVGSRLASPGTRTRPLTKETTKRLLSQAERHRRHLWHVLHLDHLEHEKYLRRLRNAALVVTGVAVVAAGITVAATSHSHSSGGSATPHVVGAADHPAVVAYPVSLANAPAAAVPSASATGVTSNCSGLSGVAAMPISGASLASSVQAAIATCSGHSVSLTCDINSNTQSWQCSMPAQEANEIGMYQNIFITTITFGGQGDWDYTGEGYN